MWFGTVRWGVVRPGPVRSGLVGCGKVRSGSEPLTRNEGSMSTKGVQVTIQGTSPLLMHAFPMVPIEGLDKKTPLEQATLALYKATDDTIYVPGVAIQRTFINGAVYSKGKGRGTLQRSAAACLMISPEHVTMDPQGWEIDSRPVVVPATKGRVMRHRPRFDKWTLTFEIEYDDVLLNAKELRKIVDDSGQRVGLLDFRPANKGPFGRFMVTSWKETAAS